MRVRRPGDRGRPSERGNTVRRQTDHRCHYPKEYALANHTQHPDNVCLKEENLLPILDDWLTKLFAPHRIGDTIRAVAEQAATEPTPKFEPASGTTVTDKVTECDAKLETYRAALEAGADPATVSGWIAEVKAERAAALVTATARRPRTCSPAQTSEEAIKAMIKALGNISDNPSSGLTAKRRRDSTRTLTCDLPTHRAQKASGSR